MLEQALENARKIKAEKNFNLQDAREDIDLRLAKEKEEEAELREATRTAQKEKLQELQEK